MRHVGSVVVAPGLLSTGSAVAVQGLSCSPACGRWSLEVSGVPAIGQLIARILREMLDMGWAFRHLEREARAALRADLETLSSTGWAPGPNDDQTTRDS